MSVLTKEARERLRDSIGPDECGNCIAGNRGDHDYWCRRCNDVFAALAYIDALEAERDALKARVAVLAEALGNACDVAVWMSGSDDFSVGGKCREGWENARVKLYAAMAARAETDANGGLS